MTPSLALLGKRRFLPLFVTQFLGAFNDNLYRTAMIMLVIYVVFNDPTRETTFSAIAGGLFVLPFFLFSAVAGQLADSTDKRRIILWVKSAEIGIMVFGAAGLLLGNVPILLGALFAMGAHSAFLGPIKYAILPQHLHEDEVLGGTGLVEAGTYGAILLGTIVGGLLARDIEVAAASVLVVATIGRVVAVFVPPAPPFADSGARVDWNVARSSWQLVTATLHIRRVFLAIVAISFFWAIGAVLAAQFPPLVKQVFHSNEQVATLFLGVFSVGVAVGSVLVNRLLGGQVSARYSPVSALVMGGFVLALYWKVKGWPELTGPLLDLSGFFAKDDSYWVVFDLFGVAVAGGMFVVPLYAFLTTTVAKSHTARTVAANNIVNSGAMVLTTGLLAALIHFGLSIADSLLMVGLGTVIAAYLAWLLHRACKDPLACRDADALAE